MNSIKFLTVMFIITLMTACSTQKPEPQNSFAYELEKFADLRILRYQVPGFENLSLQEKKLIYYLSQAAICGRDIFWSQNGQYNLAIRKIMENIYLSYSGDKQSDDYAKFLLYLKRIEFSNGIYHHYSSDKILPDFSQEYFKELISKSDVSEFPVAQGKSIEETVQMLIPVIFDKNFLPKQVDQDPEKDMVKNSAVNFYRNVTQSEVENFYNKMKVEGDTQPVSYGLNSTVIKEGKEIKELTWKSGGLYGPAIDKIIYWLEKAKDVAINQEQKNGIEKLIGYYKTGDLKTWDEYNIIWVKDTSIVDFVNGFIENYSDPLGMKATWESVVNFKDLVATKRTEIIAANAQWFEDHSPIDERFKKKEVKGVSAKVITVAMLGGYCYPHTPIGINLPNADWIRKDHGSKSVTMENITYAYNQADIKSGFLEEFSFDDDEINLIRKYGPVSDNLHTDLHECLGHGSGQLLPGISTDALKNYGSALEETRADLFALYFMMDPKIVELGLLPSLDAAKAHYISYIRNGIMTQLRRIKPGNNIEQAHMRNRQLIARWCFEKGQEQNIIERVVKDNKTYFKINDFEKLRSLMGELLTEVQRIKSEGDYEAGRQLVEKYGVQVEKELHAEVLARIDKLKLAAYSGFINPDYEVVDENGEIKDIKVIYKDDFLSQVLKYSKEYSYLPVF